MTNASMLAPGFLEAFRFGGRRGDVGSAAGIARTAHAAGSDQIKVALIGCGGRGTGAANDCLGGGKET